MHYPVFFLTLSMLKLGRRNEFQVIHFCVLVDYQELGVVQIHAGHFSPCVALLRRFTHDPLQKMGIITVRSTARVLRLHPNDCRSSFLDDAGA